MKLEQLKKLRKIKISNKLFTAKVEMQIPFADLSKSDLSIVYVVFPEGIHNKFHRHSTDQILIVTEGQGFVETKTKKIKVKEGDIIYTPKGEVHKHGALPGYKFTHISITKSKSIITQVEG